MMFTKTMVCLDGFVCPDYMSGLEGIDLVLMRFQQVLCWVFYFLNLYWTYAIFKGIAVAAGIIKRSNKNSKTASGWEDKLD